MNKIIKILLSCLIGIPLLLVTIIVGVFLVNDANEFKPTIEEQAKTQIGLNLKIEDELSWSLIPIGLEINKLRILDQKLAPFASAEKIVASIDFWSLLAGAPKVQTILVDGLNLELIQQSETENNWSHILPEKDKSTATETSSSEITEPDQTKSELNFLVESLQIINTQISFKSTPSDIDLSINPLDLKLSNITLGDTFPITFSYSLKEAKKNIAINSNLSANLFASKELKAFKLTQVENTYQINAPDISSQELKLTLGADIDINTETEIVDIASLLLNLNELSVKGQANIQQYSSSPKITANLALTDFSLKSFLKTFNISLPEMQNKNALENVALSTAFKLENNQVSLNNVNIKVDDTTWTAEINHNLDSSASKVRLKGSPLTLDGYLPPETENSQVPVSEAQPETAKSDDELLPIDTIKNLNIDFELQQAAISLKSVQSNNILVGFKAKNGVITQDLKGDLFDGNYASKSTIDVNQSEPKWTSEQTVKDIKLKPIFDILNIEALKEYGTISGLLNLNASTTLSGNKISRLKPSANSTVDFHIAEGAFEGLSLNALSCQGIALINRETVDTSTWPKATPFNTLKGKATLQKEVLNTEFDLITSGVHADSQGAIDIANSNINILASLKVIGELGNNACRVNEKVTKIGIPVKCEGALDTPPAQLCKLDSSRLGEMAKELAVEEGKRKVNKEIDRALDKHLGEQKEQVKSLLNKFLK